MKTRKYKTLLLSTLITLGFGANAQTVNIPDTNFKSYLLGNIAINTNADTEIQLSEASTFTGSIDCPGSFISDLTGIEAFTSLTQLFCHFNSLSSLDVPSNTALTELNCNVNSLTSLDVSNNTALTILNCTHNLLSSLNVSNTILTDLWCEHNLLTSMDISNTIALIYLACRNNELTTLDVSNNTALINLVCGNNLLTSVDVSNNTALISLICYGNSLTSLDLSVNTALTWLYCYGNSLTSLNMANGNNTNVTNFKAQNNPNLTCIEVDDVAYSNTNWLDIDAGLSFNTNCGTTSIESLESIIKISLYPNPASSAIYIESKTQINKIQIIGLTGLKVIERKQNMTEIDISKLSEGIYMLHIFTDLGDVVKKLIVK